jgi:hypothetical protein
MEKGDWVVECDSDREPISNKIGYVTRAAKDGSWADVKWSDGTQKWKKRVPTKNLKIISSIPVKK